MNPGDTSRPTQADYDGFLEQSIAWMTDMFVETYNSDPNTGDLRTLVGELDSTKYDANGIPVTIAGNDVTFLDQVAVNFEMQFALDEGQRVPQMSEWMRETGVLGRDRRASFANDYLATLPGVFGTVSEAYGVSIDPTVF